MSGQVCFPALAAMEPRSHTRPAAKRVKAGRRDARCLDFRGHSSETPRSVACNGCERGLAVHSVRSWAGENRKTCE